MSGFQQARIDLGIQLRQLREAAHLSGKDLAERLNWQPSKVSRIENARQTPTEDDVVVWAQAVTAEPGVVDLLIQQAVGLVERHDSWKARHKGGLAALQEDVRDLEARIRTLRIFEAGAGARLCCRPRSTRGTSSRRCAGSTRRSTTSTRRSG